MNRRSILTAALLLATAATPLFAQDAATEKALIANERAINEAFVKADKAGFAKLVAAEGFSIDPVMGRMPAADMLKTFDAMAKDMKVTSWDITNPKVLWADPNTAIVNYTWTGKGTYQGQPMPSPTYATTVWTKKNGQWMAVFHQETNAMPAPAAAKPATKK
jgi:ketosteroid isomerase-like protein